MGVISFQWIVDRVGANETGRPAHYGSQPRRRRRRASRPYGRIVPGNEPPLRFGDAVAPRGTAFANSYEVPGFAARPSMPSGLPRCLPDIRGYIDPRPDTTRAP